MKVISRTVPHTVDGFASSAAGSTNGVRPAGAVGGDREAEGRIVDFCWTTASWCFHQSKAVDRAAIGSG